MTSNTLALKTYSSITIFTCLPIDYIATKNINLLWIINGTLISLLTKFQITKFAIGKIEVIKNSHPIVTEKHHRMSILSLNLFFSKTEYSCTHYYIKIIFIVYKITIFPQKLSVSYTQYRFALVDDIPAVWIWSLLFHKFQKKKIKHNAFKYYWDLMKNFINVKFEGVNSSLTHFMTLVFFYTPWKR